MIAIVGICYRNFANYTLYRSCLPIYGIAIIRSLSFLFLGDFEGNANIFVAIKSGPTIHNYRYTASLTGLLDSFSQSGMLLAASECSSLNMLSITAVDTRLAAWYSLELTLFSIRSRLLSFNSCSDADITSAANTCMKDQ